MSVYLVESENGTPHYFDEIDEALDALEHPLSSGYLWQIDDDGNRLLWGGESFEPAVYAGDGLWYLQDEWDSLHEDEHDDFHEQESYVDAQDESDEDFVIPF